MVNRQSGSDEAILDQVPSMCDLLGLNRITPKKLHWKDTVYVGEAVFDVPIDYILVGGRQMFLPRRMQGVLPPDAWRPLIGSSLLIHAWATPRLIKTLVVGIILALAYYIPVLIFFFFTPVLGSTGMFVTHPIIPFIIGLLGFILSSRFYSPAAHMEALRTDLQVAGIIGRDTFLATLQKIDSMSFQEVQKLNRKSSMFKQPSIRERIENLQSGGRVAQVPKFADNKPGNVL